MSVAGILYIVATPIGNLKDITLRAVEVLQQADLIAAEDTRHSKKLLQAYNIDKPMLALHEHNERDQVGLLLARLQQGQHIALISDAGTPLISDPGYFLTQQVRQQGYQVMPVPGACAAIAALSAAGLPTDHFVFEGFLPAKASARQQRLDELQYEIRTIVFYESVHRIVDTLQDICQVWGQQRELVLARELTKTYETFIHGTISQVLTQVQADANQQRGEFVLITRGYEAQATAGLAPEHIDILKILLEDLPTKQAVHLAAKITKGKKNTLYEKALQLQSEKHDE
jgi:16S rRNA (cytidine1402-2'-O)-methyltransferase